MSNIWTQFNIWESYGIGYQVEDGNPLVTGPLSSLRLGSGLSNHRCWENVFKCISGFILLFESTDPKEPTELIE